jgi:hypothetical protein
VGRQHTHTLDGDGGQHRLALVRSGATEPYNTVVEDYAREASKLATIEPLDDGSFVGRVPGLDGAIAFGDTGRVIAILHDRVALRRERPIKAQRPQFADEIFSLDRTQSRHAGTPYL